MNFIIIDITTCIIRGKTDTYDEILTAVYFV